MAIGCRLMRTKLFPGNLRNFNMLAISGKFFLALGVALLATLALAGAVQAQQLLHLFCGTLTLGTLGGASVPAGQTVTAKVGGVEVGSIVTQDDGFYSGPNCEDPKLVVQGISPVAPI